MVKLDEITRGATVRGILPTGLAKVLNTEWQGSNCLKVTYETSDGRTDTDLLFRDNEPDLELVVDERPYSFNADGALFKLASEAKRISLAHLFDPFLAVTTSTVQPLPHQITAVYNELLKRQPLRFLLADDPGSGKTIMTGLFIKELMIRGDLHRCLIVAPGSLVEQWQDELDQKFQLPFEIMTNDKFEAARTGNWFNEEDLVIARLDKLSRNEDVQIKLEQTEWDLIVVDEAHKMSASFFSGEIKETKRYKLGKLLSGLTRHFLLLTATPHNGKEEDFQLFMALLDGDRFEGRFRDGVHLVDPSDLMRRLVKEQLLKFDGTRLFPERRAYTVAYELSDMEARLYHEVTDYVKEEFNRADALVNDRRKGTVGFALTILQRRLASSPEAIYQSLCRRAKRLEKRVREEKLNKRGEEIDLGWDDFTEEDLEDIDDLPEEELEETEQRVLDQATTARTIEELEAEIAILKRLEKLADQVRRSGQDRKWEELRDILQNNPHMLDENGNRRKMVIFTEHRDTLTYLTEKLRNLMGQPETVVNIMGGMPREKRRNNQEQFTQDKDVLILVATDAAGEGINLQRAHLMVNYDLPWNPNRIEQRFGRIHRIGQEEVCHLWNLVADETREGDVYARLLDKIAQQRKTLGDSVYDVLGKMFRERRLRDLLIEAVRYGDQPEVKAKLYEVVDDLSHVDNIRALIEESALARDAMDMTRVMEIREEMERAQARKLQPHFIAAFFKAAFERLGGNLREREKDRFEIPHVPAAIRSRDRQIGRRAAVQKRYERITFKKELVSVQGQPTAAFVCPGHPLLDAVIDLILEKYRDLMKQGAVLIDPRSYEENPHALVYLEHAIRDGRLIKSGDRLVISKEMQFVDIAPDGHTDHAGYAPYLDYDPITDGDYAVVESNIDWTWLQGGLHDRASAFAADNIVPAHLERIRTLKEELVDKTLVAVKERLTKEIMHWDHRAQQIREKEEAGKKPRLNSEKALQRRNELEVRLQNRQKELAQERKLSAAAPVVTGAALVVPIGLLRKWKGESVEQELTRQKRNMKSWLIALKTVMEKERDLGYEPKDVEDLKCGYDVESRIPGKGRLRFIEVKGLNPDARDVTVTANEIRCALNHPEGFILAIVRVDGETPTEIHYISKPFDQEPGFAVTSVNFNVRTLLRKSENEQ